MAQKIYIIRCSDGWMKCCSESYDEAVRLAEEHVEGRENITYVIN